MGPWGWTLGAIYHHVIEKLLILRKYLEGAGYECQDVLQ